MPIFNRNTDILNLCVDGLYFLLILICAGFSTLSTLVCLYNPREIIFVGQLIPLQYYSYFPLGILATIFHGYLYFIIGTSLLIPMGAGYVYIYYLKMFIIKEFLLGPKKYYKTDQSFRHPKNIAHLYRCVQILHEQMLCFLGPFVSIFHAVLCILPVFCNYVLFCYWGKLHWIIRAIVFLGYPCCVVIWMFFLHVGQHLWIKGNKIFSSWSKVGFKVSKLEKKVMKKFQKSCRLILLKHGKFFVVGRMTQFAYIKIVIVYTCKALLTMKK